jgi:hypothetical protein
MRYKDLIEQKEPIDPALNECDGGGGDAGGTSSGSIATFVGYFGEKRRKKGKKRKPTVIRRPK